MTASTMLIHTDQPNRAGKVISATMSMPRMRLNINPGGRAPISVATIGAW